MAKGDVINMIQDIASGAQVNFQPASSVEVCIFGCSGESGDSYIGMTNGTIQTYHWYKDNASLAFDKNGTKILINNTNYLYSANANATTRAVAYYGIQTK